MRAVGVWGLLALVAVATGQPVRWDSIVQLTTNPAMQTLGSGGQRSIAVDGSGNLHVVWLDNRSVPYQVWYRRYDNSTRTWLAETVLSARTANCFAPAVACDGENGVHVVWHVEAGNQPGIWYKRYNAAARRWQADTLLVPAPSPGILLAPAICCQPGTRVVHLAWHGNVDTLLYMPVFHRELLPDSGWRPVEIVSEYPCGHSNAAMACDSAGDLCLAWAGYDFGATSQQLFCRRRVAGVWQATELVSGNTGMGAQYLPAVAVGQNGWFGVAWYGVLNSWQRVFYRQWTGSRWLEVEEVSGGVQRQQRHVSVVCRGNGEAWAVWAGQDSAVPPNYQLRFGRRNPACGWFVPESLTSFPSGDVSAPCIAYGSGRNLHVVWCDDHNGDKDIYYRCGTLPLAVTEEPPAQPKPVAGTQVVIFDATGRVVAVRTVQAEADGSRQSNLTGFGSGVYFVRSAVGAGSTIRVVLCR